MATPASESSSVVAKRRLRDIATGADIELIVWSPMPDSESTTGDWKCAVEIAEVGKPSAIVYAHGVDSLQALVVGLAALREAVKTRGTRELAWIDQVGVVGLPLLVQESDEDFLTLVESLISAEYSRQLIERKRRNKGAIRPK